MFFGPNGIFSLQFRHRPMGKIGSKAIQVLLYIHGVEAKLASSLSGTSLSSTPNSTFVACI